MKQFYSPCLLVAEFLRDHFPQIQSEPISHFLGQVVVRAPTKKHDVRHVRKTTRCSLLKKIKRKENTTGLPTEGLWKWGKISLLVLQAWHCTGAAVGTVGKEEISCQYLHRKREVPSPHWIELVIQINTHYAACCCFLLNTQRRLKLIKT